MIAVPNMRFVIRRGGNRGSSTPSAFRLLSTVTTALVAAATLALATTSAADTGNGEEVAGMLTSEVRGQTGFSDPALRRSLAVHRSKKGGHHPSPPPPQKSGKAIARPKHGKKRSPPPSTKLGASPPPPVFRLSPPPATITGATLSPPPAPARLSPSPPPRSPTPPPPGPTVSPGNYEVVAATSDDIVKLLDSSNSARSALYGPGAPLAWSLDLTAVAQQWVDELMPTACAKGYTQFANLSVHHKPDNMYGENLFWGYWYGGGDYYALADANNDWLGEAHNYNYARNDCAANQECGHYTQVIWKGTTQVGCAMAKCKFAETPAYSFKLIACEYNPPGNWIGEKPY